MILNLDKSGWTPTSFGRVVRNVNLAVRVPGPAAIDRIIAMEHLDPGELEVRRWGYVKDGTTFTRRVKPGQTLFGKRRAYQRKVAYAEFDAICSGDILVFEADQTSLLPEFLPFLVQSQGFFDHALGTSAGSLSPRTNWRDLSNYEFLLPPVDEQKRIADLLWAVGRHGASLRSTTERLRSAATGFMNRAIASAAAPMVRLGDVLEIVRGGSPRPIHHYFTEDPDGLNWIKIGDVPAHGKYITSTAQKIKPSGLSKTRTVKPGDFLLSNSMSFGRPYIVKIHGCIHDGWLALTDRQGAWRTDFLYHLLRNDFVQQQFLSAAGGSTVKNLNTEIVSRVVVPLPNLDDQDELVARFELPAEAIRAIETESSSLQGLRSALLAQIFGGD